MTATLQELAEKISEVSDLYAERNTIRRDDEWYLIKLQEELGELTAEYLRLSGRGRTMGKTRPEIQTALEDEAADLLAHILLFAQHHKIDLEAALARKWLIHLS